MKHRAFLVLGLVGILGLSLATPLISGANESLNYDRKEMGQQICEAKEAEPYNADGMFYSNGELQITNEEAIQAINTYKIIYSNDEEATKEALEFLIIRKELYARARLAGFEVSDKEFELYKSNLTEDIKRAENAEEINKYLDGIGGIDKYWELMGETTRENLVARKYLDSQMQAYAEEKGEIVTDISFQKEWAQKELDIKNEAFTSVVSSEKFQELLVKSNTLER